MNRNRLYSIIVLGLGFAGVAGVFLYMVYVGFSVLNAGWITLIPLVLFYFAVRMVMAERGENDPRGNPDRD